MQSHRLTVMQLISDLDIGGAQETVRTLVEHLAVKGCQPIVCTFRDGPLRQEIERLGIKVEILPQRRYSIVALPLFIMDMVRIWKALTQVVKKYDVDVVQTQILDSLNFVALFLLYSTRVQLVLWTFQNAKFELAANQLPKYKWLLTPKRYAYRFLYRWTSYLVSGFVAVSAETKRAMVTTIGNIGDKITVVCNAVDTRRYGDSVEIAPIRRELGLAANTRLIAVVATLKEQKGHRYIIEAMASLVLQHPDLHALFIGDGDLREELQALARKLNLGDHIHFLGSRQDVSELLAASDLFVLPSLWEGLSVALLEAMAAGKPIVATSVSGTTQAMIPDKTGLIVPPRDAQALVDAITQLLSDPVQAQAMGQAAKQHVEMHYSARKQADEHIALYRRLLVRRHKDYGKAEVSL